MPKKLLALFLTLTLTVSLFAGLTFAANYDYKIILSQTTFTAGASSGIHEIGGSVVLQNGAYDGSDFEIELDYHGGFTPINTKAEGGSVRIFLPADLPAQNVKVRAYKLNSSGNRYSSPVAETTIRVLYNVVTDPSDLRFFYQDQGAGDVVTGTVTDGQGKPVEGATVELRPTVSGGGSPNYAPANHTTTRSGSFGFVVTRWSYVGDIELIINGVVHKTGKVAGREAKLSITPATNVPHTISDTFFTVQGSSFNSSSGWARLVIKLGDEVVHTVDNNISVSSSGTFTQDFRWKPEKAGNYTLEATQGVYSATASLRVVNPSGSNFINTEQLTDLRIGDASRNQIKIGKPNTYLVTWDGSHMQDDFVYDVYVDGRQEVEKRSTATFGIAVDSFTSKSIRLVAFERSGSSYTRVAEKTFAAQVRGWRVSLSPGTFTVGQSRDLTVTVTDEKGTPQNNATVRFSGYELNPYNYNAQNGTYVFKDVKFTAAGPVSLTVSQAGSEQAQLTLNVVGQKVYELTSPQASLLQGQEQKVRFNVSKAGKPQLPQALEMEDDKGVTKLLSFDVVTSGSNHTTIEATLLPERVGKVLVRAKNYNGSECGELELNVIAPKLELISATENITENIETELEFRIIDPRNNSLLDPDIELSANYANLTAYDEYDSLLWNNTLPGAQRQKVTLLTTEAEYTKAQDNKEQVAVEFRIKGIKIASLPIKEASLVSDPKMIVIGAPTPLTLTYLDANDKPIVGKMVQVESGSSYEDVARTDSLGQVVYPATQTMGNSLVFRAATDVSKQFAKGEVRYGYDNEDPKVTYEKEVYTASTTITITDNVRLTRLRINGKDIDIFPTKRHEEKLELKPGKNEFLIEAQDDNYNALRETITITYNTEGKPQTPTGQAVTYTIGKTTYYVDGKAQQLEAAPFLRGDHTLVPVRALQSIGAIFAWDGVNRVATFQLDGNVVKVTIGKSTAIVNNKAMAMPVAAEIVKDRTMVPFRFVGQSLGLGVHYVDTTKEIIITRGATPQG